MDETGLEQAISCPHSWAPRGKKLYGEKQGKRVKRENLVAGRRKKDKGLIAPMIFLGSLNAAGFEQWLKEFLIPALSQVTVVVMDNSPIHRKSAIKTIVEAAGHEVLFLPTYSPDLNDIEHDFAILKRARMYADGKKTLDDIVRDYCS